jgi:aldehyde:ferredoxin oxidoreductase
LGAKVSPEELLRLGAEIVRTKAAFKAREGYDPYRLRIAKRFLETPTPLGRLTEERIRNMIKMYVEKAGLSDVYAPSSRG